ncbi:SH3 domain-containing protein [Neobacillus drentensis]|uniref:SH3 domain-containing protein n=1 Tax=Neobacillus drentensis TaxID=220684 RepID=UPI00300068B3
MGLITNQSGLNVRKGPGTNIARIGGVYKNDKVQIVAQQGDWYKIKFGTGYGYINNLGVQIISTPPVVTKTGLITNPSGLSSMQIPPTWKKIVIYS